MKTLNHSCRYETFAEAGYIHIFYDRHMGYHHLKEWRASKYFYGYGLIYKNTILEFVNTIKEGVKR